MRPVLEKPKNTKMKIIYSAIISICVIVIGIAVYLQFYTEEKIGVLFGITDTDKDYSELENNFNSLFTNDLVILDDTQINITKIEQNDIIYSKFKKQLQKEDYMINVAIPYINIDDDITKRFNEEIQNTFKLKTESILSSNEQNIIYTVNYKAYVQNDILSLVIKSELKENESKQRIIVQTYNFDLKDKTEVKLEKVLNLKNINIENAENKIRNIIKTKQEKNKSLSDLGYNLYERDYTSSIYNVKNSRQYLFGKDGHIYIIYAYGNEDFTSEMDLVIF